MLMTIGQVAAATQATPKAIRHFEALGLLPPVHRRGTYRSYDDAHLQAITLIRQAQALGFTLAELRAMGKEEDCTPDWPKFFAAIAHKRERLRREIARLQERDQALAMLAEALPALLAADTRCEDLAGSLLEKKKKSA